MTKLIPVLLDQPRLCVPDKMVLTGGPDCPAGPAEPEGPASPFTPEGPRSPLAPG